jgi:hypothetical protein
MPIINIFDHHHQYYTSLVRLKTIRTNQHDLQKTDLNETNPINSTQKLYQGTDNILSLVIPIGFKFLGEDCRYGFIGEQPRSYRNGIVWGSSSSSSAHYSPLQDICLSNCSLSRSIFGYWYPAPASHPA